MLRCSCGSPLVKAELEMVEDNSFYLNMKCKDENCGKEYSVETKPINLVSGEEEREVGYHQHAETAKRGW